MANSKRLLCYYFTVEIWLLSTYDVWHQILPTNTEPLPTWNSTYHKLTYKQSKNIINCSWLNASYLLSAFKIVFIVVQLLFSWITVFTEYGDEDIRISPSSPLISSVNVNLIQVIYDIRFNHRQCLKGNLRNQNFRSFPSTYLASSWTKNRLAAITAFTWEPKAISRNGFECHF